VFPPGANFVLRLPPTPTFFLYKNPGKFVLAPYQNCPLELLPVPNADILSILIMYIKFAIVVFY
jgi:hypothetical protein